MSDIPSRLRQAIKAKTLRPYGLMAQAADEIERLRAENADLAERLMVASTDRAGLRGLLREAREDYAEALRQMAVCEAIGTPIERGMKADTLRRKLARIDAALTGQPSVPLTPAGRCAYCGGTVGLAHRCPPNAWHAPPDKPVAQPSDV